MRERAAHIAKRRRKRNAAGIHHKAVHLVPSALDLEAQHVAELPAEQRPGAVVVRVVGAAGVDDLPDAVPSGQRVGQRGGGRLRLLEAKVEGMEPALGKPAVERARRRAPGNGGIIDGGAKPGSRAAT